MRPQDIRLLSYLSEQQLEEYGQIRSYPAATMVFHQGDSTTGLWIILEGRVAVERVRPDGNVFNTGIWIPGDMVGIAGIWDGSGYPASARTLDTPTIIFWISRSSVLSLHKKVPEFGLTISKMLAERLRMVQETVADSRGRPVAQQIAVVLLTLSNRMGQSVNLTHEDIAHMIGIQRETVSRTLHDWTRQQILSTRYGEIRVVDKNALQNIAESSR